MANALVRHLFVLSLLLVFSGNSSGRCDGVIGKLHPFPSTLDQSALNLRLLFPIEFQELFGDTVCDAL